MSDVVSPDERVEPTVDISGGEMDPFDRVAEEFAERCRRGETPSVEDYQERYPEHARRIGELLPTVALMEQVKRAARRGGDGASVAPMPERFGEFRVLRELGRGGMGVVYEAVQESLGRRVALKAIHHIHLNDRQRLRFRRETEAIARLHHTNIVSIFGVGEQDGLPYYVMQYIRGRGLDGVLVDWRRDGTSPGLDRWAFVARIGVQAAEALGYAHGQGILHRDIKPANLMVDEQETAWVTDFGLAKLAGHDDLTASGDVVGTLRYMAPEVLNGETDHRSDIYSLGLTLYEMLTLSPPFGELSPSELLRHVNEEQPVRPRKLAPKLPHDLETIVLKAISREPAHRYQSADDLAGDLRRFLEDRPILARRVTWVEHAWRWRRRNRLAAALSMTTLTAVIAALAIGWIGYVWTARALRRADANVALSLGVFGELFDRLAARDPVSTPPIGEIDGPPGDGPPGRGFHPPPSDGGEGMGHRPPPGRHRGGPPPEEGFGPGDFAPGGPPRDAPPEPGERPEEGDDTGLLGSILSFYDRFAIENATDPRLEGEAAWAYRKVGFLYARLGRVDEAARAYERAITMLEQLADRHPREAQYRFKLVQTYDMADPRPSGTDEVADLARHEKWLRRARGLIDQLVAEEPGNNEYGWFLIRIYVKLGWTLGRGGRLEEAEACYRKAIAFAGSRIDRQASILSSRIDRATAREALAKIELDRGRRDEARTLLEEAVDDLKAIASDESAPPIHGRWKSLSEAFRRLGDIERSEELEQQAIDSESRPRRPPLDGPHGRPFGTAP